MVSWYRGTDTLCVCVSCKSIQLIDRRTLGGTIGEIARARSCANGFAARQNLRRDIKVKPLLQRMYVHMYTPYVATVRDATRPDRSVHRSFGYERHSAIDELLVIQKHLSQNFGLPVNRAIRYPRVEIRRSIPWKLATRSISSFVLLSSAIN